MLAVSQHRRRPLTTWLVMIILRFPRRINRLVAACSCRQRWQPHPVSARRRHYTAAGVLAKIVYYVIHAARPVPRVRRLGANPIGDYRRRPIVACLPLVSSPSQL